MRLNRLDRWLNESIDWVVDSMHEMIKFLVYSRMNFCMKFIVFNFYYHSRILVKQQYWNLLIYLVKPLLYVELYTIKM